VPCSCISSSVVLVIIVASASAVGEYRLVPSTKLGLCRVRVL